MRQWPVASGENRSQRGAAATIYAQCVQWLTNSGALPRAHFQPPSPQKPRRSRLDGRRSPLWRAHVCPKTWHETAFFGPFSDTFLPTGRADKSVRATAGSCSSRHSPLITRHFLPATSHRSPHFGRRSRFHRDQSRVTTHRLVAPPHAQYNSILPNTQSDPAESQGEPLWPPQK